MNFVSHNGETYPSNDLRWRGASGALLDLDFQPTLDAAAFAGRPPTMWRYREAIPIENDAHIISFDEGFTPLHAYHSFTIRVVKFSRRGKLALRVVIVRWPDGTFRSWSLRYAPGWKCVPICQDQKCAGMVGPRRMA